MILNRIKDKEFRIGHISSNVPNDNLGNPLVRIFLSCTKNY